MCPGLLVSGAGPSNSVAEDGRSPSSGSLTGFRAARKLVSLPRWQRHLPIGESRQRERGLC